MPFPSSSSWRWGYRASGGGLRLGLPQPLTPEEEGGAQFHGSRVEGPWVCRGQRGPKNPGSPESGRSWAVRRDTPQGRYAGGASRLALDSACGSLCLGRMWVCPALPVPLHGCSHACAGVPVACGVGIPVPVGARSHVHAGVPGAWALWREQVSVWAAGSPAAEPGTGVRAGPVRVRTGRRVKTTNQTRFPGARHGDGRGFERLPGWVCVRWVLRLPSRARGGA